MDYVRFITRGNGDIHIIRRNLAQSSAAFGKHRRKTRAATVRHGRGRATARQVPGCRRGGPRRCCLCCLLESQGSDCAEACCGGCRSPLGAASRSCHEPGLLARILCEPWRKIKTGNISNSSISRDWRPKSRQRSIIGGGNQSSLLPAIDHCVRAGKVQPAGKTTHPWKTSPPKQPPWQNFSEFGFVWRKC